jgi:energy-coupling factor transporter ATP-binding protein EcfA2
MERADSSLTSVRQRDIPEILRYCGEANMTAVLVGPPGCGKTTIARLQGQVAQARYKAATGQAPKNQECVREYIPGIHDPTDATGLPNPDHGARVTTYYPPDWMPLDPDWAGILLLDEVGAASHAQRMPIQQIMYEHRIEGQRLSPWCQVVATTNRAVDGGLFQKSSSAFNNRVRFYDVELDHQYFQSVLASLDCHPLVLAWIRNRPEVPEEYDRLIQDPARAGSVPRAFATQRSVASLGRMMHLDIRSDLLTPVVASCIGEGYALDFIAFVKMAREVPDLNEVLKKPDTFPLPEHDDLLYVLVCCLAQRMSKDEACWNQAATFLKRLGAEFQKLCWQTAAGYNKTVLARNRHFVEFAVEHEQDFRLA